MKTVGSHMTIHAPKAQVWDIISNLTAIQYYLPGLQSVRYTSDTHRGVGASRYCIFEDGTELHERIHDWNEGISFQIEIFEFVKVPMKSNLVTFELSEQNGQTTLHQSMQYEMKGGIFALILERVFARMMKKTLDDMILSLKNYVEAQPITERATA